MTLIPAENGDGIMVISVGTVFAFLAIVAFALRIWAHKIQKVELDWSDYACGAGLLFALALLGITVDITVQGLGLNVTQVTPRQLVNFQKGLIAGTYVWMLSTTFIRLAVLLLYIQLFRVPRFCQACYGVLGLNVVFAISIIFATSLICQPFALQWNPSLNGSCGDTKAFYLFLPIFNLLLDVTIVILPLPILWGLQMPRSKKVALSLIFGMGAGICILTLFRIIETARANLNNPTKDDTVFGLLGLLEPSSGVIACCLPFLRPVAGKITKSKLLLKVKGSTRWRSGGKLPTRESDHKKRFERLEDSTIELESGSLGMNN